MVRPHIPSLAWLLALAPPQGKQQIADEGAVANRVPPRMATGHPDAQALRDTCRASHDQTTEGQLCVLDLARCSQTIASLPTAD